MHDSPAVAYVVSQYPAVSHVFIEREVLGLRALGLDVKTFSARRPPESLPSETMRSEAAGTVAVQADKARLLQDNAALLARSPGGYLSALRKAVGTGDRRARARVWQVFYLAEAARIHAEMVDHGIRHIHAHFANNGADIARMVTELGRALDGPDSPWSWSFTMHGSNEFEAVQHFDLPAKVASASRVACISDFTRSQLMRFTDPREWDKLELVRMSVDLERFSVPAVERHRDGPLRVLYVGRLVPEKGTPLLIQALAELTRKGVPVEARLVGDGPLRESLAAQIAAAGLTDKVRMVGVVGQDAILEHYHWADVFCLPSFQEGLPVVLMEAMATGLPVVTTRIAGIGELVLDRVNGRLLTPGRWDLVEDSLAELAADPDLRFEWGRRGRESVEADYSMTGHAARQLEFLQKARRDLGGRVAAG